VLQVMDDMRAADVDFLTIGQYLQPTPKHHAVDRFVHPDEFAAYEKAAYGKGFLMVSATPLTRSSYHAGDDFERLRAARHGEAGPRLRPRTCAVSAAVLILRPCARPRRPRPNPSTPRAPPLPRVASPRRRAWPSRWRPPGQAEALAHPRPSSPATPSPRRPIRRAPFWKPAAASGSPTALVAMGRAHQSGPTGPDAGPKRVRSHHL
jgi:hypothetical protein